MHQIQNFYSANYFWKEGEKILEKLKNYFEEVISGAPDIQVLPSNNPEKLYKKYNSLLKEKITGGDFIDILINDSNHLHHPGYIGHQCAAPNPVAAFASLVGSLLNNGSAVYEMGPANVAMERTVAHFFAREYNFPEGAEGLFTSGGSLGNLTALLAARQSQTEYDIWEEGVRHDDQPAFMISEASHYCIHRAVKIMGLGEKGIINIPVDNENRIRTDLLEDLYKKSLDNGKRVIALTANACSTSTGSYDKLEKIAEFCQKFNIWFHIDGAHGGAAILSEKYRHFLKGSELADSIVIDFHKMLMTPGLNTLILFSNGQTSYSTFAQKASYLLDDEEERDWYNYARRTMECTKSMMGLNVYMQLLLGGKDLFAENIDRLYDMGKTFAAMCESYKYIEVAMKPDANIVCFRFNDQSKNLDEVNKQIRNQILKNGNFYVVQTRLQGKLYLRVSIMNPLTREEDFQNLLNEVTEIGGKLRK